MARYQSIIITPRPVTPPDLGDTRWRRFLDTILFRRGLRQRLSMMRDELYAAYREVEAANQRRTEAASAAHEGMFKIESLGVLSSEVATIKDIHQHALTATVEVASVDDRARELFYNHETVAFEGLTYVVKDLAIDAHGYDLGYGQPITLHLQGVVINK